MAKTIPRDAESQIDHMKSQKHNLEALHKALDSSMLKTEHALIGTYLKRIKKSDNDRCWWCTGSPRQTRTHLFKECRRWKRAQNELWEGIAAEKDEEGNPDSLHRNTSIPTLFAHLKATRCIMEFLRHTEVGRRVDEKRREDTSEKRNEEWGWNDREGSEETEVRRGGGVPERAAANGGGARIERGGEG